MDDWWDTKDSFINKADTLMKLNPEHEVEPVPTECTEHERKQTNQTVSEIRTR